MEGIFQYFTADNIITGSFFVFLIGLFWRVVKFVYNKITFYNKLNKERKLFKEFLDDFIKKESKNISDLEGVKEENIMRLCLFLVEGDTEQKFYDFFNLLKPYIKDKELLNTEFNVLNTFSAKHKIMNLLDYTLICDPDKESIIFKRFSALCDVIKANLEFLKNKKLNLKIHFFSFLFSK